MARRVADVTLVHNTKVEIIWTTVPVLILIGMAIPAAHGIAPIGDDANLAARHQGDGLPVGVGVHLPRQGT